MAKSPQLEACLDWCYIIVYFSGFLLPLISGQEEAFCNLYFAIRWISEQIDCSVNRLGDGWVQRFGNFCIFVGQSHGTERLSRIRGTTGYKKKLKNSFLAYTWQIQMCRTAQNYLEVSQRP
jgi:hypothetical protein